MTVPTGEYVGGQDGWETEDEEIPPVRVLLAGTTQRQNAPDFGGASLYTLPVLGTNVPVQILQRRPTREQAYVRNLDPANSILFAERIDKVQAGIGYILGPGLTQKIESQQPYWGVAQNIAGGSQASINASGSVTNPAALQAIASAVLPAGTYIVNSVVYVSGTTAGGDASNFGLYLNGVLLATYQNSSSAGAIYTPPPETVVVPAGGGTLAIESIAGAALATSIYRAQFSATPNASGLVPAPAQVAVLDEAWIVINEPTRQEYAKGVD